MLNPAVTSVWNLNAAGDPAEQVFLSHTKPGPIELDTDELTEHEQYNILMALGKRQLTSPQAAEFYAMTSARQPSPKLTLADVQKRMAPKGIELPNADLYKQAEVSLLEAVGTIKKSVTQIDNIRLLRIMKELEGSTKARKSVMEALDHKIQVLEQDFEQRRREVEDSSRTPGVEVEVGDKVTVPLHTVQLEYTKAAS